MKRSNPQSPYLNTIIKTITAAGIVEIVCLLMAICMGQVIAFNHRQITELETEVVSEIHNISGNVYQYQKQLYALEAIGDTQEDFKSELSAVAEEIRESIASLKETAYIEKNEQIGSIIFKIETLCEEYLETAETVSAVEREEQVRSINSQIGFLIALVNTETSKKEEISNVLNVISSIVNLIAIAAMAAALGFCIKNANEQGKELVLLKEEAESANEAKTAFLSNMSHEIRTPINAIMGMNEMILRYTQDDAVESYASDIKSAAKTLLELVNDILDISKVEAGKMDLVEESYKLGELITKEAIIMRPKAEEKGLVFRILLAKNLPSELYGDELRIRQIVTNIINNAIKYTSEGSVSVFVSAKPLNEEQCRLVVTVKDTGAGIKQEDMKHLFEKFRRVDEVQNKGIEGTGIGLHLTKQMLELMHGTIHVESEYGKGSSFTISIPQRITDTAVLERLPKVNDIVQAESCPVTAGARILLTDDNELNRKTMTLLLQDTNIEIDTAASGMECISKLNLYMQDYYDMVFLDHLMPDMDGIKTLQCIKKNDLVRNTPIIMLTANAMAGLKEQYMKAGFTDYLSKPVNVGQLNELLRKYLPPEKIIGEKTYEKRKAVKSSSFLDIYGAEENAGSFDNYKCMMKDYCDAIEPTLKTIEYFIQTQDYNSYVIKVHSLKSTSRTVGWIRLGDLCEQAEKAGKQKQYDKVMRLHKVIMQEATEILHMKELFQNNTQHTEGMENGTVRELRCLLESIIEASEAGDMERTDFLVKLLDYFIWNKEQEDVVQKVKDAVVTFDYEKLVSIVEDGVV